MAYKKLSSCEKKKYIDWFVSLLPAFRAKAGITSEDIANMIGVSRQTYSAIENGRRDLSWNTLLSLVLFFEYNNKTRGLLHSEDNDVDLIFRSFNPGETTSDLEFKQMVEEKYSNVNAELDKQAKENIQNVIMQEYQRCRNK